MTTHSTNNTETRVNEDHFPIWKESFCNETRRAMIDEDLSAGYYVPYLLVGCATIGIVLGVLSVFLTA